MTSWVAQEECSAPCGTGYREYRRQITQPARENGKACEALVKWDACNTHACPINCVQSQWSAWSECSKTCGEGSSHRSRHTIRQAANDGIACDENPETKTCNPQILL